MILINEPVLLEANAVTISKKDKQTTQTDNSQSSPKMLLQTIGSNHLQKKYGQLTDYKSGRYNFWKMGDQVLKYYVHTDVRSKSFITALSKPTVLSSQKENATFIFIKYYGGLGNVFTVYFFQPEIICCMESRLIVFLRASASA